MTSIKQILNNTAEEASAAKSQIDSESGETRPYPVYLVKWNKTKNTVLVRKWGAKSGRKKEYPLDVPPKLIPLLNLVPGDKLYYYPRSYLGNKGGVIRPGWAPGKNAFTTRKKASKIFPNTFFGV